MSFIPSRVLFEEDALDYELGQRLLEYFKGKGIEHSFLASHNRVTGIPGNTPQKAYAEGKKTLVVGVRRTLEFSPCKPSAHYQLPIATSCTGKCEYCYLNTQLGAKPYLRVYVNIDEILGRAQRYIEQRDEVTVFEASATSDPVPVEPFTGSLAKSISFFSRQSRGRLRFVTKFTDIESILGLKHNGNTTIRFSINADNIIKKYEHQTPSLDERVGAISKIHMSGYPIGFIIAPVFVYSGWEKDYDDMLSRIKNQLAETGKSDVSFEVISHRFTKRAKSSILNIFPQTDLPMNEEKRKFKFGQFGYGKYIYPKETLGKINEFFSERIGNLFPEAEIKYII